MNVNPAEIERLVRDALSRLVTAAPAEFRSTSDEATKAPAAADALVLTGNVVTLAEIEGRLGDKRRLIVSSRAIVTPAVRDVLRKYNIALERGVVGKATSASAAKGAVSVAVAARFDAGRVVARLRQTGYAVQQLAGVGLAAAVRELGDDVVRGGSRGLLLADEAEAAVVALNRRAGVRAIGADDPQTAARATAAVGANVLVVRPAGKSEFVLQRIVAAWIESRSAASDEIRNLLN